MDREKQIEEMARIIHGTPFSDMNRAVAIYDAGFRKQSEGEWKQAYNSSPRYCCTHCNHLYNNKSFKYCPHCGAKMDGGKKQDDSHT